MNGERKEMDRMLQMIVPPELGGGVVEMTLEEAKALTDIPLPMNVSLERGIALLEALSVIDLEGLPAPERETLIEILQPYLIIQAWEQSRQGSDNDR